VHIYVSRGSQKALAELPQEIAGVPCTTHNIGKLYVKPHQSAVTTHCGNLYEHGGRVACGSSCAPSGKSYSGTLGAIVRKSPNGPLFALSNNHVGQGSHGFIIPMDRVFSAFGGISLVGGHGV
jgi:hypothetical protein